MMPTGALASPAAPPEASGHAALMHEWCALERDHEQAEKSALMLKVLAILMCFIALAVTIDLLMVGFLVAVVWLQEAIVRTSQARLGQRLLRVEEQLRRAPTLPVLPFQLHSEWGAGRAGTLGLLREYAVNAVRPTVAFPYGVLLLILFAALPLAAP